MSDISRVVLISGATGGVGKEIANYMAKCGYSVGVGFTHHPEKAKAIVDGIKSVGGKAIDVYFDYLSRDSIKSALVKVEEYFGSEVSILINNGAISQEKTFDAITDADWDLMMKINLQGPFVAVQEVLPSMERNSWGRIINISSIGGQWGGFNQVHYAASKAGLINLTRSLAKIYSKSGIVSVAVAIGLVETEMSSRELASEAGKEKVKQIPAQRLATVTEISKIVEQLCHDEMSYLTGQTLNVNGGMYFG